MEININEVKKELYRNKDRQAKFNRYCAGNLYYHIEVLGGMYEFPIKTVDIQMPHPDTTVELLVANVEPAPTVEVLPIIKLSSDLGTTAFGRDIKASELNRWISQAVEAGEFVRVG